MVTSLALIFLLGLAAAAVCRRAGLPRIIGMLLAGIARDNLLRVLRQILD